jgi:hypothetical protein
MHYYYSLLTPTLEDRAIADLANDDQHGSQISNSYGDGPFHSLVDEPAPIGHQIPDYRVTRFGWTDLFLTFCFILTTCWSDDRYESLCRSLSDDEVLDYTEQG